jgi:outer membrane protein assembly factor BamB
VRTTPILLCAISVAGCTGDDPITIIERWNQAFAAEPAPPGIGPEKRVLVALQGSTGELTTHEEGTGLKIEGPHPTFPTSHAPVASNFTMFLVSTVGRIVGLEIGSGTQKSLSPATPLGVTSPLVVAPDGSLRIGSTSGRLFAMQPDGTTIYDVPFEGPIDSAPAVASDGTTYAAIFTPGKLIGVSTSGDTVFEQPVGESAGGVSVSDARVAVGHNSGMKLFERAGAEIFSHPRQARVTGTRILADGRVLVWGEDGIIQLLDDGGGVVWTYNAGPPILTDVNVMDGRLALFDSGGTVHLLDLGSGEMLRMHSLGGAPGPRIVEGELGFVYVSVGTKIVALDFFVGE